MEWLQQWKFLAVMESESKFWRVKVTPAWSDSGVGPPWLADSGFSLFSHMAEREREGASSVASLFKGTDPMMMASPS